MDGCSIIQKLLLRKQYDEALSLAKSALLKNPSSSIYTILAAYASFHLKKYDEALSCISTYLKTENIVTEEIKNVLVLICNTAFVDDNYALCLKAAEILISNRLQVSDDTLRIISSVFDAYGFTEKSLDALNAMQRPDASSLMSKALLLQKYGERDQALWIADEALRLAPSSEVLAINYATLLLQRGDTSESRAFLERFVQCNEEAHLTRIRLALSIPPIITSQTHALEIRNTIHSICLDKNVIDTSFRPEYLITTPPFYLAYHGLNDRGVLENIADIILKRSTLCKLVEKSKFIRGDVSLRHPTKRKIGFLSWHFSNHTLMSYFFRLLLHTAPQLADCYFIEQPQQNNPFRQELGTVGKIITLPSSSPVRLQEIVHCIENLDLDILVYLELAMDLTPWLLAFTHPAKMQCTLYGHPMTTGIPSMDFYLSPAPMEPADAQQFYTETLVSLPCLLSGFFPVEQPSDMDRARVRQRLPAGITYLCVQSLFKIHPAMDTIFLRILQKDPEAQLVFFDSSDKKVTSAFTSRLASVLGRYYKRTHFLQQCSEVDFLAIMQCADVVLDTIFFSGGATSYKALGIGVPVVTHEGEFMRGRQTSALYQHMGVAGPVAKDPEEYCNLALELAHSPDKRRILSSSLRDHSRQLFDINTSVEQFASFLSKL